MLKLLTLDSNVFISETKGDEEFSDKCSNIISRVGSDFLLVEPTILLAEIGNAIGRNIGIKYGEPYLRSISFAFCRYFCP